MNKLEIGPTKESVLIQISSVIIPKLQIINYMINLFLKEKEFCFLRQKHVLNIIFILVPDAVIYGNNTQLATCKRNSSPRRMYLFSSTDQNHTVYTCV